MKSLKIPLFLFLTLLLSSSTHKYYLSLTQIKFVEKEKAVQIIINVFMDDIELAINKKNNINLALDTEKELPNHTIYFKSYLFDNLSIRINSKNKKVNYLGKEYEGNLVYFYLEIKEVKSIQSLEILNKILINNFSEQQNLVKIKVFNKHKSVLLTKKNNKALLKF